MKIAVCIRQGRDGEINPFDASAYETALQIRGAEITLISMGPMSVQPFLQNLTRLGGRKAILLSDRAFAGSDTLATAYILSLAVSKIQPDLVICGRQTLEGDTAQTGPMLSVFGGFSSITNVLNVTAISEEERTIECQTRREGVQKASLPALITVERSKVLRLPSIRSRAGETEVWNAQTIHADLSRCGLGGSPTRVLKTFENEQGRRHCHFIRKDQLEWAIAQGLEKHAERIKPVVSEQKLKKVCIVGEAPRSFAEMVTDNIEVLPLKSAEEMAQRIRDAAPDAVLWGSDDESKRASARTAALLRTGLCADCTSLETDGETLFMYRPALSGTIIAKIKCLTSPAMATVRTVDPDVKDVVIGAGFGVKDQLPALRDFAKNHHAGFAVTRKLVDQGYAPYEEQVGLTGRTVSPAVYLAVGVSGAVHHIVGMQQSQTVIAVNPDRKAPIFDYADFGITEDISWE